MKFAIFLPDETIKEQRGKPYPVIYALAGLTCTHETIKIKGQYGHAAKKHRIAMVFPDTSPRDIDLEGIKDDWWFGESAGYYLNATNEKYSNHFNMYDYITKELPTIVNSHFHVDGTKQSITGMSMGGLGALQIFLKNSEQYKSVSAFCPISNPQQC